MMPARDMRPKKPRRSGSAHVSTFEHGTSKTTVHGDSGLCDAGDIWTVGRSGISPFPAL